MTVERFTWEPIRAFAHSIEALLAAVDRDAKPGSRIIVGNTDLRRTPYVDTFLYYLLPRLVPGTYFMEFEPGLTNRAGTRLTAEMRRADLFIASDRWLSWDEPNTSMKPGDPGPGQVLRRDFCLQASYGNGYALVSALLDTVTSYGCGVRTDRGCRNDGLHPEIGIAPGTAPTC